MEKHQLINGCAFESHGISADLICTDPPFDMDGIDILKAVENIESSHLVLLCSMRQAIEFSSIASNWKFNFDFVLNLVAPKQSKSIRQPNYNHVNGLYFTKGKAKSIFSRKLHKRHDTFVDNGYWPTIIKAASEHKDVLGYAKNIDAMASIIGSFDAKSVADPFAGSGSVLISAHHLGIDAFCIEKDVDTYNKAVDFVRFFGVIL